MELELHLYRQHSSPFYRCVVIYLFEIRDYIWVDREFSLSKFQSLATETIDPRIVMTMLCIGLTAFSFHLHWSRGLVIIKINISKKYTWRGFTFYNVCHFLFLALPFGMVGKKLLPLSQDGLTFILWFAMVNIYTQPLSKFLWHC